MSPVWKPGAVTGRVYPGSLPSGTRDSADTDKRDSADWHSVRVAALDHRRGIATATGPAGVSIDPINPNCEKNRKVNNPALWTTAQLYKSLALDIWPLRNRYHNEKLMEVT